MVAKTGTSPYSYTDILPEPLRNNLPAVGAFVVVSAVAFLAFQCYGRYNKNARIADVLAGLHKRIAKGGENASAANNTGKAAGPVIAEDKKWRDMLATPMTAPMEEVVTSAVKEIVSKETEFLSALTQRLDMKHDLLKIFSNDYHEKVLDPSKKKISTLHTKLFEAVNVDTAMAEAEFVKTVQKIVANLEEIDKDFEDQICIILTTAVKDAKDIDHHLNFFTALRGDGTAAKVNQMWEQLELGSEFRAKFPNIEDFWNSEDSLEQIHTALLELKVANAKVSCNDDNDDDFFTGGLAIEDESNSRAPSKRLSFNDAQASQILGMKNSYNTALAEMEALENDWIQKRIESTNKGEGWVSSSDTGHGWHQLLLAFSPFYANDMQPTDFFSSEFRATMAAKKLGENYEDVLAKAKSAADDPERKNTRTENDEIVRQELMGLLTTPINEVLSRELKSVRDIKIPNFLAELRAAEYEDGESAILQTWKGLGLGDEYLAAFDNDDAFWNSTKTVIQIYDLLQAKTDSPPMPALEHDDPSTMLTDE